MIERRVHAHQAKACPQIQRPEGVVQGGEGGQRCARGGGGRLVCGRHCRGSVPGAYSSPIAIYAHIMYWRLDLAQGGRNHAV